MTLLGLGLVLLLILGNAYFVAAEFALVAARRSRLEQSRLDGDRRAGRVLTLLEKLSFALSGAQLGITVTSLGVGFIAEGVFTGLFGPLFAPFGLRPELAAGLALALGLLVSTATQMVIGELGPKNLAIARAEDVARSLAASQILYLRLFGPVIRLFDNAANGLLRAVGIEPAEEIATAVTVEELEHIIASSGAAGALAASVAGLLKRSIEFRDLKADDAMRPRSDVQWISADATCTELIQLASRSGHTRFPVTGPDGLDDVRGVVSIKELLEVSPDELDITQVRALAEVEVAVPESAPLPDVLRLLRDAHTQMAIVIDEFGGTSGIVTLEDIVEELIGEIRDEHDRSERSAVRRADGSWRLPGLWRIDEVRRDTGIELPNGQHDTVGGLVMAVLGRIPRVGDHVEVDGVSLDVLAMNRHAVQSIRLSITTPAVDVAEGGAA